MNSHLCKKMKTSLNRSKKFTGKKRKYLDLGLTPGSHPSDYFVVKEDGKLMRTSFVCPGETLIDVPPCDKKYMALQRRRLD